VTGAELNGLLKRSKAVICGSDLLVAERQFAFIRTHFCFAEAALDAIRIEDFFLNALGGIHGGGLRVLEILGD